MVCSEMMNAVFIIFSSKIVHITKEQIDVNCIVMLYVDSEVKTIMNHLVTLKVVR